MRAPSPPARAIVFVFGLLIGAVGLGALFVPSGLSGLADRFDTPAAFYVVAGVRITFGLLLMSAAPASRLPRTLRSLGAVIVVLGVVTVLTGLLGAIKAQDAIGRAFGGDALVVRSAGVVLVVLGAVVAYACGPVARSALSRTP